ncbi:winged helix DNA-binding domain-containing protein, partial [Rickenella mellea]
MMGMEPGVPLSLSSLRDPEDGQKPDYTYPVLIKLAIHESPTSCLTLQEIYEVIQRRFPWYANCSKKDAAAWRNSIRHTLSLLAIFQKKSRPITEPGKGHYWYLDFTKGAGYKRQRKRNKKPTKA